MEEREHLVSEESLHKPERRRWYLLVVFSLLSFHQSLQWLTFSSIPDETSATFPLVDKFSLFLLLNWGPIVYIPIVVPASWLLTKPNGLRRTVLLSALGILVGSFLRSIPSFVGSAFCKTAYAVAFLHMGQIVNAAVGPLVMASPSKLSAVWFPDNERTTATAIGAMANNFGSAVGFLLGPWLADASHLLFVELGFAAFLFVLTFAYFPDHPVHPPSFIKLEAIPDASPSFFQSLRLVASNPSFLLLVIAGGVQGGVNNAWNGALPSALGALGYSEGVAGWFAFANTFAGIVAGVAVGVVADRLFPRRFKTLLLFLFIFAIVCFVWFTASLPTPFSPHPFLPSSIAVLCAATSLAGFFLGGTNPIFYEMGAELTYPVPEGTSAGVLTLLNNIGCLIFLFAGSVIPPSWINLVATATIAVCLILFAFVHEEYRRLDAEARNQLAAQSIKVVV